MKLLPGPDEQPRCASWSRAIALDPRGTAFHAETVTLIGVPAPWPKPVFDHPLLGGLATGMKSSRGTTRVLAFADDPPSGDRLRVLVYAGFPMVGTAYEVPALELARHVADPSDRWRSARPAPERVLAVCTQGSHDVCCGTDGTRFAAEAESRPITVLRVSHTGGHRFAPTALVIPDGRMWARMDLPLLDAVLERRPPDAFIDRCRGLILAPAGAGQVAECAVFAAEGWSWQTTAVRLNGGEAEVVGQERVARVTVVPRRQVPTISCRQPGGVPAKQAVEYEAVGSVRFQPR